MQSISIFEMIKIGIGPSSSHTMGPWLAAGMFVEALEKRGQLSQVTEVFTVLYGSLAKTGVGHGSDIAIMLGLIGEDYRLINPSFIPDKIETIERTEIVALGNKHTVPFIYGYHLIFQMDQSLDYHPNGMRFTAKFNDGSDFSQDYFSLGGGFVSTGEEHPQSDKIVTPYPCHSAAAITKYCEQLQLNRISDLVMINEQAWQPESAIRTQALSIWEEIKQCIFRGVHKSGVLPGGLDVQRRAAGINHNLLQTDFDKIDPWLEAIKLQDKSFSTVNRWVNCFALAVNEENASFSRIITAPTNGASGVIPAVLMYAQTSTNASTEEDVIRFILVAGEIGTLFKKNATISAAMGGCQAEVGVSSAMAAAGLTEILGGSPGQVLMAAEIAMEHHLGLTCDPVAGLVQIPCIERNTMGAIKAISAAYLALESDPAKARVHLDEVIQTMWETAQDMNAKYKETSEGGLAVAVNVPEC